jgi:hypothetical protein
MEDVSRPSHGEESQPSHDETFLEKVDAAARSGRNVDRTYGVGEPDAPPVKRKPSWIVGLVLLLIGSASLWYLFFPHDSFVSRTIARIAVLGVLLGAGGVVELLNWEAQRKSSLRK